MAVFINLEPCSKLLIRDSMLHIRSFDQSSFGSFCKLGALGLLLNRGLGLI